MTEATARSCMRWCSCVGTWSDAGGAAAACCCCCCMAVASASDACAKARRADGAERVRGVGASAALTTSSAFAKEDCPRGLRSKSMGLVVSFRMAGAGLGLLSLSLMELKWGAGDTPPREPKAWKKEVRGVAGSLTGVLLCLRAGDKFTWPYLGGTASPERAGDRIGDAPTVARRGDVRGRLKGDAGYSAKGERGTCAEGLRVGDIGGGIAS
mmetsp:Transcript_20185/g.54339  ORF Transcript_20185/g.54339 Transcript_20185/m.54339 type:complete len:212 (-) Transcript_20185:785-1420(-)